MSGSGETKSRRDKEEGKRREPRKQTGGIEGVCRGSSARRMKSPKEPQEVLTDRSSMCRNRGGRGDQECVRPGLC